MWQEKSNRSKVRVNVLTEFSSPNSLALVQPLLVNKPFLSRKGINFNFFERINERLYDCDILFINSKVFRAWRGEREKDLYDTLSGFKKRIKKLLWFDTTDSTGTTQFNIMPFVDGYYKNQVLRDRSLYTKAHNGHRLFTEFILTTPQNDSSFTPSFKKDEAKSFGATPLQKAHAHKLKISWNSAMVDWGRYNFILRRLTAKMMSHLPLSISYGTKFVKADKKRSIDISGRFGLSYSRKTIQKYREDIAKILEGFKVANTRISKRHYLNEIRNSKIGVSPFGWGEVCYRDFEIIINGALLFKGDMSHLETWPPLYVDNETYIPYAWDLKDFEEKLRDLLSNRQKIIEISKKAQELYAYYLYGTGRLEFCDKVLEIIG